MLRGEVFGRVARFAARRPLAVLVVFAALAAVGLAGALTLDSSASTDTLVDSGADAFEATEEYQREFGDDAIVVLVRGDLQRTLLTADLGRLLRLEGCLSGRVPPAALASTPAPCREIAEGGRVQAVYGPGTFINTAVREIQRALAGRQAATAQQAEQAARAAVAEARRDGLPRRSQREAGRAARAQVMEEAKKALLALSVRYGITSLPSITDPSFVSALVFDTARGVNVPKARFAYLFPSSRAAVVQVRPRPGLSEAERSELVEQVRRAVAAPEFAMQEGGRYLVTGVPVIEEDLADEVGEAVLVLLLAGLLVMAVVLPLVFRSRLRLLPLLIALGATAVAFGLLALVGGSLTMASIAALPVLIGLAVDYGIQYQARFDEELEAGRPPPPGGEPEGASVPESPAARAATRAASLGGPVIASAALASGLGFVVLILSPVPMVRGFGAIVLVGVAIALVAALTAGTAALVRFRRGPSGPAPAPRTRVGARLAGTRDAVAARVARAGSSVLRLATRHPRRVLAWGLVLAVLGLVADTQTRVVSDVRELVPPDMSALRDVNALTEATGVAGEVDVTVRADDLFRPEIVRWMTRFQREALAGHGYRPGVSCTGGPTGPELCPGFAITDLLSAGGGPPGAGGQALVDSVPRYLSQAVISADRRTANIAFGIRLMPLDRQQEVVEDLRERLEGAPPGVTASVAGAPVLVAEGNASLASPWRRLATLLFGLAAVFAVLLAVRRRFEAAAVPLVPIALAAGWSALILFVLRIPLNPLSAALGGLVIAISTEFGVILSARYAEERAAGFETPEALRRTFDATGPAVLASGATAIAGFAAVMASDIRMLRDFGVVTVVDLSVSLVGVIVVLPAALVWAEERGGLRAAELDPRRWAPAVPGRLRALAGEVGRLRRRSHTRV